MIARVLKIGLWLVALIGVCFWAQQPKVSDSLLMLFTLGKVPGTNIMLSPGATMWWVGSLGAAVFLLAFGSNIYRGMRRLFATSAPAPETVSEPVAVAAVAKVKKPKKPAVVIRIRIRDSLITRITRSIERYAPPVLKHLGSWLQIAAKRLAVVARASARLAIDVSRVFAEAVLRHVGAALKWAIIRGGRLAVAAWHWVEPHLRRFDAYLGKRVNSNESVKTLKHLTKELSRVLIRWRDEVRAYVGPVRAEKP
jgi:hypothetical protein